MTVRKLQFTGAFFDGRSAEKHHVNVELTPQEIIITKSAHKPIHWAYSHIRLDAVSTCPLHIEHSVADEKGERLETLVVDDPDFYGNIIGIAPSNFSTAAQRSIFSWKFYVAGTLALIFSAYFFFKVMPPFLADQMVNKIPVEWEDAVGQSILKVLPIDRNPDKKVLNVLQDTIDLLGKFVEGNQPYDLTVYISPVKQANALALPGGSIVVFEGLLNRAESPEELAGILAHEIQHILLRHSTQGILRNMTKNMLMTLLIGDVNAVMEGVVNLAGELDTLGLSREMEMEADQKGMELILAANIDPHGMIRIFKKLSQEAGLPKNLPEEKISSKESELEVSFYFSTHPSGQKRLAQLEKQVKPHEKRIWTQLFPDLNWNEIKPEK